MVSTRKSMEGMGVKKPDRKRKRVPGDYSSEDSKLSLMVKDSCPKSSKQGKRILLKSDVDIKNIGRHLKKKAKSLLYIDSDFEDSAEKVVKEDKVEVHSQKMVPRQKHLKIWDLFYEERNRNFSAKIIYWCDMEVPNIIKNKLSDVQLNKFKLTCFGKFLEFGQPQMFSQIIHQALIREVYQRDDGELWFLFGERRVRFGLPEFCLISGLNWQGNEDIDSFKGIQNLLVEKFFGDEVVTRSTIGKIYRSVVFYYDDEAVMMSIILLVFNFILASVSDNYIEETLLNFLSYGDVESYPWGKFAFQQTKNSLSIAVKGHVRKDKHGGVIYNFYRDGHCKSYKLNGLPYVFQVFLFETIPTLKVRGFCVDDHASELRLFRWRELGKPPKNEKLNDLVFGSGQLIVQNIVPTDDEKVRLGLGGFHFFNGNDIAGKISDVKVESSRKFNDIGFSISDVEEVIDKRVKPLEGNMMEMKKDIENLGVELKDQLEVFQMQICMDVKKMIRKFVYGQSSYRKHKNVNFVEDDDNDDGVDDAGDGDGDGDGGDDNDDVDDADGSAAAADDDELGENVDVGNIKGSVDPQVGGVVGNQFEEEDSQIESKNVGFHSSGIEIVVYTPRGVKHNVEDEKAEKMDDVPSFDLLSQSSGKEIVVFTPIEGNKFEGSDISILDDMVFTTQDLIQCSEVEKSAARPIGRPVRTVAKSAVLKSPFTSKFGSAGSTSADVGVCQIPQVCQHFPDICMCIPTKDEDVLFERWFKIGLNNRKRIEKFPGNNDIIEPSFRFGSVPIASKMWFYKLKTPGQWLDDDHINICLYYIRKVAKHSNQIQIRVTTTDCWFHIKLTNLYGKYCNRNCDKTMLLDSGDIAEYIHGFLMEVNTPWVNVDFVMFPIHMSAPGHWFLLVFDVHRRVLVVYNSLQQDRNVMRKNIMDVCKPYIFILPIILSSCGFWKNRTDIDFNSVPYRNKGEHDIFELDFAKGIPEQIEGDCGMFTICYAAHFIHQMISEMPKPFPILQYRRKLCVNLFNHARRKHLVGYESDLKYPGRLATED